MRPWSASGAFSAAEYEDAKRRVRRLEPPQALPALDIENKSSRARKTASQTAVSSGPPPCSDVSAEEIGSNQKKPKPVAAEGTFLGSLQSNIRELSLLIENRLSANAQLRATVGADFSELQLHVDRNLVALLSTCPVGRSNDLVCLFQADSVPSNRERAARQRKERAAGAARFRAAAGAGGVGRRPGG